MIDALRSLHGSRSADSVQLANSDALRRRPTQTSSGSRPLRLICIWIRTFVECLACRSLCAQNSMCDKSAHLVPSEGLTLADFTWFPT
eukprot:3025583-Pleurochrysis_carterae.AAC.1